MNKQQYPLPDDLYDSKDWRAGSYSERVEWLYLMYEDKKQELQELENRLDQNKTGSLNEFNPNWDLLESTQEALREYVTLNQRLRSLLEKAAIADEIVRSYVDAVVGYNQEAAAAATKAMVVYVYADPATDLETALKELNK